MPDMIDFIKNIAIGLVPVICTVLGWFINSHYTLISRVKDLETKLAQDDEERKTLQTELKEFKTEMKTDFKEFNIALQKIEISIAKLARN
jgi:hypothetical protein